MTHPMTCERFADNLADLLEREMNETDRTSMEAHAFACGDCGPLLGDLRKLRVDAGNLPELVPSRNLWSGIEARIATPVIDLPGASGKHDVRTSGFANRARQRRKEWALTGLAAAALVVVTAGVTHVVTKRVLNGSRVPVVVTAPTPAAGGSQPDTSNTATIPDSPDPAFRTAANTAAGSEGYDREIAQLRAVLNQRRTQLDPLTVGVVERNLLVIDGAIAQCREALRKDPASRFLLQSLSDELQNKVELLRRATKLPLRTS